MSITRTRPRSGLGLNELLCLMSNDPLAKVLFRVPDEDGGASVETLWATPLGNDLYKLDNSPFYAYGVSWEDTVFAPIDPQDGLPAFHSIVKKSGNRTVRVIFDPPVSSGNASDHVLQGLLALGCMVTCTTPPFRAAARLNSGVRSHVQNSRSGTDSSGM